MIRFFIKLYIYMLLVEALLSYFPQVRVYPWYRNMKKMCDFTLNPVRQMLPPDLPIDPSPLVVILLLNILMLIW
jgi:uncharacterized protein YggT (Ycf19 family)